ncbi:hypothetical protein GCM10022409_15150 [Hymenobacter glaciei]|uniref:Secretion system C-terminal sorting domain-containing protein n=2 Tax=Hymenobacter glaciei TaxID=877209 RepID=A0ABP7TVE0_9BACT
MLLLAASLSSRAQTTSSAPENEAPLTGFADAVNTVFQAVDKTQVCDSYGRLRLEHAGHGTASLRLRVDKLPAGLYVVHVLHGRNQVSRQQLQLVR